MKKTLLICFLCCCTCLSAQNIRFFWTKDTILIGDQTQFIIECDAGIKSARFKAWEGVVQSVPLPKAKSFNSVEIISFSDTVFKQKKQLVWHGTFTITAWDTGIVQLPPIKNLTTDTAIFIQSSPLVVVFQTKKYNPNIEELKVSIESKSEWGFPLLVSILVFVSAIFAWFYFKKRNTTTNSAISFQQKALNELERLKKDKIWVNTNHNQHYIQFSLILKVYLGHRFGLYLMERTTEETLILLRIKELDPVFFQPIKHLLEQADLVKFGKMIPSEEQILAQLHQAIDLVKELEHPIETE